jgi:hypothetical protein
MLRLINLIFIGALLSAAGFVYSVKYDATFEVSKITKLTREIAKERDKVNRLNAEWAYLNRPEYLQPIVEKHLAMQPLALSQVGMFNLRDRQAPGPDPLTRMLEALERADKEIITAKIIVPKTNKTVALKPVLKPKTVVKQQTLADVIAGLSRAKP